MKETKYGAGKVFITNEGYNVEVIKIIDGVRRRVKFLDKYGAEKNVRTSSLWRGSIKNPYHTTIYGIGYFGEGGVVTSKSYSYDVWKDMLRRCYDESGECYINYKDCEVCKEWFNFQTFAEWYNKTYPHNLKNIKFNLDEDLLQQNIEHKIYSSNTCVFLPKYINIFLSTNRLSNTSGTTGVSWHSRYNIWESRISFKGKITHLGRSNNKEELELRYKSKRAEYVEIIKTELRVLNYLKENIINLIY